MPFDLGLFRDLLAGRALPEQYLGALAVLAALGYLVIWVAIPSIVRLATRRRTVR